MNKRVEYLIVGAVLSIYEAYKINKLSDELKDLRNLSSSKLVEKVKK